MHNLSTALLTHIDHLLLEDDLRPTRRYLYQLHRQQVANPRTSVAKLEALAAEYGIVQYEDDREDESKAPRIHHFGQDIIHHIHTMIKQNNRHPRRKELFDYIDDICNGVSMNRLLRIAKELGI